MIKSVVKFIPLAVKFLLGKPLFGTISLKDQTVNEGPFDLTARRYTICDFYQEEHGSMPHANTLASLCASLCRNSFAIDQKVVRKIFVIWLQLLGESVIFLKYYNTSIMRFSNY